MIKCNPFFLECIEVILKNEGGYVFHPNDPGGETNYGIARLFYPDLDIKNLTKTQAIQIYYDDYWNDLLSQINDKELALQIFDASVNHRHHIKVVNTYGNKAIQMIQQLVQVEEDRIIGQMTLTAINNYEGQLLNRYKHARKVYYEYLASRRPGFKVFLKGWLNRVEHTHF
jgi:lysozyme family protein